MLTVTKKGQKNIVKAAFLAVYAVFLLAACQNGFVNDALKSLNPSPVVVAAKPKIEWGAAQDQLLYIDPRGGTMAGTLSGRLNSAGRKIWFKQDQSNSSPKKWEFVAPADETYITPDFLTSSIDGSAPSATSDVITLKFGTIADLTQIVSEEPQNYSFILYPSAFTGAHIYELSTEAATLNFKVEMPSATNYAKRLIEKKADYPDIDVSWTDAANQNSADPIEGMKFIAGSLAANSATAALEAYLVDIGEATFSSQGNEFSENATWISPPDGQLSKGYWQGNGAFRLEGFYIDTSSFVQPEISVPVNFTSNAGEAVALIQGAEAAGSFSNIPTSVGSAAIWETVVGSLAALDLPVGGSEAIWIGGGPAATNVVANDYPMSIILGDGNDGSPEGTVTITVNVVE